ncbi:hypothetical protein CXB51_012345 [Gossypium anomalum]|uniref:Phytocyanin domain-containing protein n=1 Tax=Gossypium anomalum TaxID=47600 RepID=A0A8J6D8F1_9ROSI|nr:hypothetical protein CXB51_012345 [Gossypium anomalum]
MKRIQIKLACLVLLMVTVENTQSRDSVLHRVGGGRYSWKPNVNFTDWAIHEQFFCCVDFGFNKQLYSVLQVNETSYANCIEENFINNITKGGRDVFNLTMPKPYYFISGRGYCFKRMKVAIFVQNYQPLPITNGSLLQIFKQS